VKLFGLAMVLLCLISLFLLPIIVRADDPPVLVNERADEIDWNEHVVYNITDTGTYAMHQMGNMIVCDHGETYRNMIIGQLILLSGLSGTYASDRGWTFSGNVWSRRVFFTIGIVNASGMTVREEDIPPEFTVYKMAHIPFDIDMIQKFNSRIEQTHFHSMFDFNNDGIINMRDISITIRNFALHSP